MKNTLLYKLDRAVGLPRLLDPNGMLHPDEHATVDALLQKNHTRLVEDGRRSRVLRIELKAGPTRFRVTVRPGTSSRCPTLVLQRLAVGRPASCRPQAEWVAGLLAEWKELLHARMLQGTPEAELIALEAALAELADMGRHRPDVLARLLLAGRLEQGKRDAIPGSPELARQWALASRAVARTFSSGGTQDAGQANGSSPLASVPSLFD